MNQKDLSLVISIAQEMVQHCDTVSIPSKEADKIAEENSLVKTLGKTTHQSELSQKQNKDDSTVKLRRQCFHATLLPAVVGQWITLQYKRLISIVFIFEHYRLTSIKSFLQKKE